jgi:hypothetical protein
MIDGDVAPTGVQPNDQEGQIRVQPYTLFSTGHEGVVFQFKKKLHVPGAFDYFAEDLRNQWSKHAKEDPKLFE